MVHPAVICRLTHDGSKRSIPLRRPEEDSWRAKGDMGRSGCSVCQGLGATYLFCHESLMTIPSSASIVPDFLILALGPLTLAGGR